MPMGDLADDSTYYDPTSGISLTPQYGDPSQPPTQGMTLPEKYVRAKVSQMGDILAAPGNVMAGKMPMWQMDPETGEFHPSNEVMSAASGLAGLAMTGGLAGTGPGGFAVGAGPIRAFHGSPHDFERFDLSKIGTGEGAQYYGHGLYFAESEPVAKSYRDALAPGQELTLNGVRASELTPAQRRVAQWIENTGADPEDIARIATERAEKAKRDASQFGLPGVDPAIFAREHANTAQAARDLVDAGKWEVGRAPRGHMYEVNINADPVRFLDWDKSLAAQPELAKTISQIAPGLKSGNTGAGAYTSIRGLYGSPSHVSAALNEAGIPGIKYLDQGSRSAGTGTSNYVVFNDKLIDILKKYGIVGALGAGGMGSLAAQDDYQQE